MKTLTLLVGIVFALAGCGTYHEKRQIDDSAYLLLIGEPAGNVVTIDDNAPIDLSADTQQYHLNGSTATKIKISRGSHTLKIQKDGKLTVNRKFFVATGESFEVEL